MSYSLFAELIASIKNQNLLKKLILEYPDKQIDWNESIVVKDNKKEPLYSYVLRQGLNVKKTEEQEFYSNFVNDLVQNKKIDIYDGYFVAALLDKNAELLLKIMKENSSLYMNKLTNKEKVKIIKHNDLDFIKTLMKNGINFFENINPLVHIEDDKMFRFFLEKDRIDISAPIFDNTNMVMYLIKNKKHLNIVNTYIQKDKNNTIFTNGLFENNTDNVIAAACNLPSGLFKRIINQYSNESALSLDNLPTYINFVNQDTDNINYNEEVKLYNKIVNFQKRLPILLSSVINNCSDVSTKEELLIKHLSPIKKALQKPDNSEDNLFITFIDDILKNKAVNQQKIIDTILKKRSFSHIKNTFDYEFLVYILHNHQEYFENNKDNIHKILVNSINTIVEAKQESMYTTFDRTINLLNDFFPEKYLSKLLYLLGNDNNKAAFFNKIVNDNKEEFLTARNDIKSLYPEIYKKIFENKRNFLHKNKESKALYESVIIMSTLNESNYTEDLKSKKRL